MTETTERARRGPRGEYAKTGAKREAILAAALGVFAESGYRAGSLREIATRVGMSEAGLLHHFPNKEALLAAVLDRRDGDDLSRVHIIVDAEDGAETLRGLVELAAHNASVPGVVELYCTLSAEATSPDHPAHGYFLGRYDWARGMVGRAFERIARDGRLREGADPARAAIATLALMDGLQVQWLLNRDVVDMSEALREYFAGLVADF
ncbi:TetR/AcrR family transcriptional regulator [Microbacterium sp. 18062]|uniref:TetR/AcrR family transcriptional regulator n=1 Tax=Microbacterium sp. 18062 TaxID=2681410 RepID=UPI0013591E27|nr:TetR/AcrR family transcriptional regulator [Microbacterium sp. 18062]